MNDADRDQWLERAASEFQTPAYVYFTDVIEQRIALLRDRFDGRFALSYAVKCNPNPALLRWLNGRIEHLDISSVGELRLAVQAGWDPAQISFTGPAKRQFELEEAIAAGLGLLVVESLREARMASAIASRLGMTQQVLVRIAPDSVPKGFGDQMAGRPCPFGIDMEDADAALREIRALPGLTIAGLHIYSGTQSLKPEAIVANYRNFMGIFAELSANHGLQPEQLVFGSGMGIAYHDNDVPLALDEIADSINPELDAFRELSAFADTELMLELGRYLVGEAGYFLARVVSIKESRGTRIAICDGGMNNHLPAAGLFGMVMRRNYSMHKVGGPSGPVEKTDISGPLCTSIDRLASGVELPRVEEGDLIAIHNSGGYGLTASPIHFISHSPPAELLVCDGSITDVSRNFVELQPVRGSIRSLSAV
ncbi:MAG: type III PLP-dependent enzyme [Novosphingobium sp.]